MALIPNPVPARLRGAGMVKVSGQPISTDRFVKGSAPSTTPDLEEVFQRVRAAFPDVKWWQLSVTHEADDDGLWFFWLPDSPGDVQIESSNGICPFLVETDKHDDTLIAHSPTEAADTIIKWLQLPGGRLESSGHPR